MSPLTKKTLFWDTNVENLDVVKHKRYIIERILQFGDIDDYNWMRETYSKEEIINVIIEERSPLNPRSLNFWCQQFGVKESICTKKLLAKTQELFWVR